MGKLKNKLVLLVDDDSRNTFSIGSYLEELEMKIIIAEKGEEAIFILLNDTKPDIILLDMMMPVMDGYETLNSLRENGLLKQIPVIAATARAMKGDSEKCIEAGAWDYISKPINLNVLADKIIKWII